MAKKEMNEMEEDLLVSGGKKSSEKNVKTKKAKSKKRHISKNTKKIVSSVVAVVVVVALLATYVATGTIRHGFLSYIGAANNLTAATVTNGEDKMKITVGQYNYYFATVYNSYKNMAAQYSTYGLDPKDYGLDVDFSKKLSKQETEDPDNKDKKITWLERIEKDVLEKIRTNYLYYNEAIKANNGEVPSITDEQQKELDETMEEYKKQAEKYGYTLSAYLVKAMGKGVTEKVFKEEAKVSYIAENYAQSLAKEQSSKEYQENEYETYLKEHKDELVSVNVKIFECDTEDDAKKFKDELKANGSNFADLAVKYSADAEKDLYKDPNNSLELYATKKTLTDKKYALTVSNEDGKSTGLDWLFSSDRKSGDIYQYSTTVVYVISPSVLSDVNTVDVRHILIKAEKDSTSGATTEAKWKAAYDKAEKVLKEWKDGEKTETSFAALAKEYSEDNAEDGGLYEDVVPGQMVNTFGNWCFDSSRKVGDTAIVQSTYGYHIMYFVGPTDMPVWKYTAKQALASDDTQAIANSLDESYKIKTNWFGSRFFEIDTDIDFGS